MRTTTEVEFDFHIRASSLDISIKAEVDRGAGLAAFTEIVVTADKRLHVDVDKLIAEHPRFVQALSAEACEVAELWWDATRMPREVTTSSKPLDEDERVALARLEKQNNELCDEVHDLREKLASVGIENARLLEKMKGRAA